MVYECLTVIKMNLVFKTLRHAGMIVSLRCVCMMLSWFVLSEVPNLLLTPDPWSAPCGRLVHSQLIEHECWVKDAGFPVVLPAEPAPVTHRSLIRQTRAVFLYWGVFFRVPDVCVLLQSWCVCVLLRSYAAELTRWDPPVSVLWLSCRCELGTLGFDASLWATATAFLPEHWSRGALNAHFKRFCFLQRESQIWGEHSLALSSEHMSVSVFSELNLTLCVCVSLNTSHLHAIHPAKPHPLQCLRYFELVCYFLIVGLFADDYCGQLHKLLRFVLQVRGHSHRKCFCS